MDTFRKIVADIKSLKIQGATAVARSSLDALKYVAANSKAKNKTSFVNELEKAKKVIYSTRETEPLMRNSLRYITYAIKESSSEDIGELKHMVAISADEFLFNLEKDKERIAEIGSNKIESGMTVLTHCHSTTVTEMFRLAKEKGKKFSVICTETRPNYQGHITAKELIKYDIPTTMIVDSAVSTFVKKADAAFVGCDLITSDISLVNKVGTFYVSLAAKRTEIPFYCAAELAKFDPETLFGKIEQIEHRPGKEVWKEAPKKLKILNPVFDITPRENISAFITQEGVVPPSAILDLINNKFPWIFKGVR
jgi:ribose 1,5-bisphosphate isomerase